jgi:hypothetical protein
VRAQHKRPGGATPRANTPHHPPPSTPKKQRPPPPAEGNRAAAGLGPEPQTRRGSSRGRQATASAASTPDMPPQERQLTAAPAYPLPSSSAPPATINPALLYANLRPSGQRTPKAANVQQSVMAIDPALSPGSLQRAQKAEARQQNTQPTPRAQGSSGMPTTVPPHPSFLIPSGYRPRQVSSARQAYPVTAPVARLASTPRSLPIPGRSSKAAQAVVSANRQTNKPATSSRQQPIPSLRARASSLSSSPSQATFRSHPYHTGHHSTRSQPIMGQPRSSASTSRASASTSQYPDPTPFSLAPARSESYTLNPPAEGKSRSSDDSNMTGVQR